MKNLFACLTVFLLVLNVENIHAAIDYNTGGEIELSSPLNDSVRVDYNAAPGIRTAFRLVEDGFISGWLSAHNEGLVTIDGGSIGQHLEATGHSQVVMDGGSIGQMLAAYENSQVVIYGGTIGWSLEVYGNAQVTIYGFDFMLDGIPVSGEIAADLNAPWSYRLLTGTLVNEQSFSQEILIQGQAAIFLIPEPATGILLALSIAAALRHRPHRQ